MMAFCMALDRLTAGFCPMQFCDGVEACNRRSLISFLFWLGTATPNTKLRKKMEDSIFEISLGLKCCPFFSSKPNNCKKNTCAEVWSKLPAVSPLRAQIPGAHSHGSRPAGQTQLTAAISVLTASAAFFRAATSCAAASAVSAFRKPIT